MEMGIFKQERGKTFKGQRRKRFGRKSSQISTKLAFTNILNRRLSRCPDGSRIFSQEGGCSGGTTKFPDLNQGGEGEAPRRKATPAS
jgi:hypothetical protein